MNFLDRYDNASKQFTLYDYSDIEPIQNGDLYHQSTIDYYEKHLNESYSPRFANSMVSFFDILGYTNFNRIKLNPIKKVKKQLKYISDTNINYVLSQLSIYPICNTLEDCSYRLDYKSLREGRSNISIEVYM